MEHAGPLRVRSWLFDEFVKQVGDVPQHSFAFRLVFQAPDRTLEDAEINTVMDAVHAACVAKGWTVR
jgi:phenylalanyl-tRNA synthetase beta subunit